MVNYKKLRLGDILLASGLLTNEQLNQALQHQKISNQRLGKSLIELNMIKEEDLIQILSNQLQIEAVDLKNYQLDADIAKQIPEHIAYKYNLLPIKKEGNQLTVAMNDPLNLVAIEDVEILTKCQIKPVIALEKDLNKLMNEVFRGKSSMEQMVEDLGQQYGVQENLEAAEEEEDMDSMPVVRLVNSLMQQAVRERASDVHLEPQEKEVVVRFRIDGVLQEKMIWPKNLYGAISSRIKINSGMNIAEKRVPQDGRSKVKENGEEVDLRVSTLPTIFGEKIVMRLLRNEALNLSLQELGYSDHDLYNLIKLYTKPYGMLLVTGPTGSGKTTTLYSILKELNSIDKNITTIEDPVEYRLDRINQVQVNPKAGLSFASVLRSLLRQDPDIIMVGELRDEETVRIGIQSALTGHFVLSTIHTNNTSSTISRLLDMGIEPYLITSSLLGIVAQRLVRRVCPRCREKMELPLEEAEKLNLGLKEGIFVYHGQGCPYCSNTGYYGRIALSEILFISPEIKQMILNHASAEEIEKQARKDGMKTLFESGLEKLLAGETSVEELFRVTLLS